MIEFKQIPKRVNQDAEFEEENWNDIFPLFEDDSLDEKPQQRKPEIEVEQSSESEDFLAKMNLFGDDSDYESDYDQEIKKVQKPAKVELIRGNSADENLESYNLEDLFFSQDEQSYINRIEPQDAIRVAQGALKKRNQSDWLAAVDEQVEGKVVSDEIVELSSGDFITLNARHPFDYQGCYPQYPKIESPFANILGTWLFKENGVEGHQTFELLPNGTVIYSDPWPVGRWKSSD